MEGFYSDPKHGHCMRRIRKVNHLWYHVDGVYGDDEVRVGDHWHARMQVVKRTREVWLLRVDFGGKPILTHERFYDAEYDPKRRVIRWQDGNVWRKMFVHPSQLT